MRVGVSALMHACDHYVALQLIHFAVLSFIYYTCVCVCVCVYSDAVVSLLLEVVRFD